LGFPLPAGKTASDTPKAPFQRQKPVFHQSLGLDLAELAGNRILVRSKELAAEFVACLLCMKISRYN
jgi:hypothetical protein